MTTREVWSAPDVVLIETLTPQDGLMVQVHAGSGYASLNITQVVEMAKEILRFYEGTTFE